MKKAFFALLAATTSNAVGANEYDEDLIALGHSMVSFYCQDCHAIAEEDASTHAVAPPFRTLHERYDVELLSEALVEGLVTAHPDMPEFEFEPIQAEGIIAYLKSLEPTGE